MKITVPVQVLYRFRLTQRMDQDTVTLTFDPMELETSTRKLTRTFTTSQTPEPDVIAALSLIQKPEEDYCFNQNHPPVSPSLMEKLEPTIQQRINLLNTRMTSKAKDCDSRESYNQMIHLHVESIKALGNQVKKLVVAGLKDTMMKKDVELVRFAVSKRLTVWRTSLELVKKRPGTWDQRDELWKRLIIANRMSWSAYHLKNSIRL